MQCGISLFPCFLEEMDKENVRLYVYIKFSLKKEKGHPSIWDNADEPGSYAVWNKPTLKGNYCIISLYLGSNRAELITKAEYNCECHKLSVGEGRDIGQTVQRFSSSG